MPGIWAAALGGASPFLLFMSGSYMAHPATMLATAGALYAFVRAQQAASAQRDTAPGAQRGGQGRRRLAPGGGWFLASGLCLGWCFISREATALGVAIPFVAWAIIETATSMRDWRAGGRSLARYGLMALGALPPLALLAAVDQAQQGSPLRLAQELVGAYNRLGFGPGVGPRPAAIRRPQRCTTRWFTCAACRTCCSVGRRRSRWSPSRSASPPPGGAGAPRAGTCS